MSDEPLTYTRFLECLDKSTMSVGIRPKRVSMNGNALTALLNSLPISRIPFPKDNEEVRIAGVEIELDDALPDHVVRIHAPVEESEQSPRNTQFAGFAKLVVDDLMNVELAFAGFTIDAPRKEYREEWEKIVAQRAYDLVCHTIWNIKPINLDRELPDDHVLLIPDMTIWPEDKQ